MPGAPGILYGWLERVGHCRRGTWSNCWGKMVTPNTKTPKFMSTVSNDWQANSAPPPQPPEEEKSHAILPSTFIQYGAIGSSQNRCIFQESRPMLVGLPST